MYRYLVTTQDNDPFFTQFFTPENHFVPDVGMVVYGLVTRLYTDDGRRMVSNRSRPLIKKYKMEHSQFIEDFGLPIIGLFLFIIGVLAGLNLSVYIDRKYNK